MSNRHRLGFTPKEIEVMRLRREGLKVGQIAQKLDVSESDISQTLKRVGDKIRTFEDSVEFLNELGIIEQRAPVELTPLGDAFVRRTMIQRILPDSIRKNALICPETISQMRGFGYEKVSRSGRLPSHVTLAKRARKRSRKRRSR